MAAIDKEVIKNYHNQMVSDINNFGTDHPKRALCNADFANQLYTPVR